MKWNLEAKVGVFVLFVLLVIAYVTVLLSDRGGIKGGGYTLSVVLESAEGLIRKTPVEVAGIQVGYIKKLDLVEGGKARALMDIDRRVVLGKDAVATVRTKGFLGETYIDLKPGNPAKGVIPPGGQIEATNPFVDVGRIASDADDFIQRMRDLTAKNEENVNQILDSLAIFSQDLQTLFSERKESIADTMDRLSSVSRKVDEGRGTLGRLVNDEEIAENINEAARGVSAAVGGVNRFQFEFGYHLEYLAVSNDFKNYVGLNLKPRPDKYFILEFVVDPEPSADESVTTAITTTGGASTTTVTEERVVTRDDFRISAQLAKSFYDFTFRGGVIESTGGAGLDWGRGPFLLQFSAFDFRSRDGQKPHLKALGRLNLTKNIFLVSGVDDIISTQRDPDWFVGAGLNLIDEDIKSLFSAATLGASSAR